MMNGLKLMKEIEPNRERSFIHEEKRFVPDRDHHFYYGNV